MKKMQEPELKVVTYELNDILVTSFGGKINYCHIVTYKGATPSNEDEDFTITKEEGGCIANEWGIPGCATYTCHTKNDIACYPYN